RAPRRPPAAAKASPRPAASHPSRRSRSRAPRGDAGGADVFVRPTNRAAGLAKNRLEAVVDGVTGFVLTVLVFDIVVPARGLAPTALPTLLREQGEPLFAFFV